MENIDLMVLVPHEDDELAIAGPLIYQAAQNEMKIKVVFSTNGDFFAHEGPIRIREAIKALHVLGVEKKDIIFLGYGDQTKSNHLYNAEENEIICSYNGNDTTYGISDMEEFAMQEYGEHHKYTRTNFKCDTKNVIKKYHPRIIVTTAWDNHMDHIALSLIIDEVLGEILREEQDYYPLVLKGLAYNGKWEGHEDYYSSVNVTENVNQAIGVEKVYPLNKWEDRIRFLTPKAGRTELLKNNVLYKAAREYQSQNVDLKAIQFINQDLVFWRRPTESLTYHAIIQTSSGNSAFLKDFKCADCSDIVNDFWNYDQSVWLTDETDEKKCISIELEKATTVKEIHFFENPAECCKIQNIKITFDNGEAIETGELNHDGSRTKVLIHEMVPVKKFSMVIDRWSGEQIGLTEIEIYSHQYTLEDYVFPLQFLDNESVIENEKKSWKSKIEEKYIHFLKYARGRLWPDKFFLMKRYPGLKESDSNFTYWKMYVKFVFEKVLEKVRRKNEEAFGE